MLWQIRHSENSLEESQNHKILEIGKVLWRLSSPTPLQVQDFVLLRKVCASSVLYPVRVPLNQHNHLVSQPLVPVIPTEKLLWVFCVLIDGRGN